jgi:tRNA nucleotidyltransferase (CCA-adding enzyme)
MIGRLIDRLNKGFIMIKKEKNRKLNLKIKSKDIDPGALFITKRLNDSGYEALVVGGCIRNLIMGEEARDWDITTKAAPEKISRVFKEFKVIPVGKKFGTLTVVINHINYEVSTFKKNKSVPTPNLLEDLRHRDFTINALAWREGEGVIDCFNGFEDIKQKIIRGVENPVERINEDPLRMLRAIRLACELDFKIDKVTLQAIEENSPLIKKVSVERIRDEFTKILLSNHPRRGFKLLYRLGLLRFIMPELQKCAGIYRESFCEGEDLLEYTLDMAASCYLI